MDSDYDFRARTPLKSDHKWKKHWIKVKSAVEISTVKGFIYVRAFRQDFSHSCFHLFCFFLHSSAKLGDEKKNNKKNYGLEIILVEQLHNGFRFLKCASACWRCFVFIVQNLLLCVCVDVSACRWVAGIHGSLVLVQLLNYIQTILCGIESKEFSG